LASRTERFHLPQFTPEESIDFLEKNITEDRRAKLFAAFPPKRIVTNLSCSIVELEGFASAISNTTLEGKTLPNHFLHPRYFPLLNVMSLLVMQIAFKQPRQNSSGNERRKDGEKSINISKYYDRVGANKMAQSNLLL